MKKIFFGLLFTSLLGCNIRHTDNLRLSKPSELQDIKANLSYIKDSTTNLCFAVLTYCSYARMSYSIACVPCDSVKKLLNK